MTYGKLNHKEELRVKSLELKKFTWQGCEYTYDPKTNMIGGHMEFHLAHASPDMLKYIASVFPTVLDD